MPLSLCKKLFKITKKAQPISKHNNFRLQFVRTTKSSCKMSIPTTKFCNDVEVPIVGFGTWRISSPDTVIRIVKEAIDIGYRHFDCASSYGNQREVGRAIEEKIKAGDITRDDLFITSKLWNTKHHPSLVRAACEETLRELKMDYLDNYLIHWPVGFADSNEIYPKDDAGKTIFSEIDYIDTWSTMEELVDAGLCRSIGLSNFNQQQIERVLDVARIPPTNLQIECHPYLTQSKLRDFCNEHDIRISAYSPLGSPHSPYEKPGSHKLLQHPKIIEIANTHDKSPAQILLRYQLELGNIVITMSTKKENMAANLLIGSFTLSDKDMNDINGLNFDGRYNVMKAATGHPYHPFESQLAQVSG